MEFNKETKTIVVFSKKYELETLVNSFCELSGKQMENFFVTRTIQFPKKIHYLALIKVLNEEIKKLNSLSLNKGQFTKLQHYANYTEFQLIALMAKLVTPEAYEKYRRTIWELIFENYATINLSDGEVQHLMGLKKGGCEDFSVYSSILSTIGMDIENEFDCCPKENLEDSFKYVYSSEEMIILAKSYGINLSTSVRKEDLIKCVKSILKERKRYTPELGKELDGMTNDEINAFCKKHKIQLSTHLNKTQMVVYFQYLIKKKSIPTLKIKRIVGTDFIKPLVFSVDLSVIKPFGKGEAQKIIYLEESEEPVIEEVVEEIVVAAPVVEQKADEPIVEEVQEEPVVEEQTEEVVEEVQEEPVVEEVQEEPVVEEVQEEPVVEEVQEEPVVEEVQEEPVVEEVQEEPVVEEQAKEVVEAKVYQASDDKGNVNPYFRNKKVEKKKRTLLKLLLFVVGVSAIVAAALFLIKYFL